MSLGTEWASGYGLIQPGGLNTIEVLRAFKRYAPDSDPDPDSDFYHRGDDPHFNPDLNFASRRCVIRDDLIKRESVEISNYETFLRLNYLINNTMQAAYKTFQPIDEAARYHFMEVLHKAEFLGSVLESRFTGIENLFSSISILTLGPNLPSQWLDVRTEFEAVPDLASMEALDEDGQSENDSDSEDPQDYAHSVSSDCRKDDREVPVVTGRDDQESHAHYRYQRRSVSPERCMRPAARVDNRETTWPKRRHALTSLGGTSAIIANSLILMGAAVFSAALGFSKIRSQDCKATLGDDGFWGYMSQMMIQLCSLYFVIIPALRDHHFQRYRAWFYVCVFFSTSTTIAATFVYVFHTGVAGVLTLLSEFFGVLATLELTLGADKEAEKKPPKEGGEVGA